MPSPRRRLRNPGQRHIAKPETGLQNSSRTRPAPNPLKATPPVTNWPAMCRPAGGSTPPRRLTKRQPRLPTSLAFLQVYCTKARLASGISVAATRQTEKEGRWGRRTLDEHGAAAAHARRLLPPLCRCHTKVECARSLRLSHPVFFSRVGLKGCDSTRRLKPHCRDP